MTTSTIEGRAVEITMEAADTGHRLDVALASHLDGVSRAVVQRWIGSGLASVGGRPAKSSTLVTEGDVVTVIVPAPRPETLSPEDLPLPVVYEDTDLAVVNKPAGMVVHPSVGHTHGTVVNALLHHLGTLSQSGGPGRPGIVHRLDKGTSGLMVVAKNDVTHRALSRQFHDREVLKEYLALVWGRPKSGLVLDNPLGRDPRHRQKVSSRARRGRAAVTTVLDAQWLGGVSLVRLSIGTGRTHQIRVHLSEAGFPVVGDSLYGGERGRMPGALSSLSRLSRPFLHAARLEFRHPRSGIRLSFEAPLPDDLSGFLAALGRRAAAAQTS
jgi:23S rRNA pseudouridine1911/1915/1917 synthase